jgi:uncharacterized GH25 family protein
VPRETSATLTTDETEEGDTATATDKPQATDTETDDSDKDAGPPRIVDGFVTGHGGAIAGVKATVTLSIVDEETKTVYGLPVEKPVKTLEYTTDENGRYAIVIPDDLATNAQVRVIVKLMHPKFLGRQMGPVHVTDFDGKRIGNDQPYWLMRQMARQVIKQSRLRKANHLTGRILLPDGTPAVGAKVKTATKYRTHGWKFHSTDDYGASDEAVTDGDGQFSIVIDRSASLTAMMAGQAPLIIHDLKNRIPIANGDAPTDFRLPPANRIKGRVVTADGNPVPRAIVTVMQDAKRDDFFMLLKYGISCAADELGYYELPPLPTGTLIVYIWGQLEPGGDTAAYSKFMAASMRNGLFENRPGFRTEPLHFVFVRKRVILEPFSPFTTLELQAVPQWSHSR